MEKKQFEELVSRISDGSATEREIALYNDWYNHFQQKNATWDEQTMGNREMVEQIISERIHARIGRPSRTKLIKIYARVSVAAAVLCLAIFTLFKIYSPVIEHGEWAELPGQEKQETDIQPGRNRASLHLADGTYIDLDSIRSGDTVMQSGITLSKAENGELIYDATRKRSELGPDTYNTLSTPRGGQYQIILPDGTKVWLNAVSSLRFPVSFAADKRKVELSGEAYFEVSRNKNAPFVVSMDNAEVEVLGTSFNISAYPENAVTTTLISGSVKVRGENDSRVMVPGQQAVVDGSISINKVDTELAVAWKNGWMAFSNEEIRAIMEEASRWYDVDVVYRGSSIAGRRFTGDIHRSSSLSEFLKVLELSGIHAKIEGRQLVIFE